MADLALSLTARFYPLSRESLVVGGVAIGKLAEKYGTPFFVYDASVLDVKFNALRSALPSRFAIFYSVKANPSLPLVRHFLDRGCGLEIASAGEFQCARASGCPPGRILFAGPGKSEEELDLVLSHGIGEIHVESLLEAGRIVSICRRLGRRARVSIRINPVGEVEGGAMRMGGRPAPFGIDEEMLSETMDAILSMPELDLSGIHLFTGTQILDAGILLGQYHHGLNLARRVAGQLGRPLYTLDFGGGLGIPYFSHERELDLAALRGGLEIMCAEVDKDPIFSGTQFLVEPGRFLAGEAGIYVARVSDVKVSRGKKFVIVDGGMNHHLAASGNLGQTIKRNYPIAVLNKVNKPSEEAVDIVGPLCTPLDTLGRSVTLPRVDVGDLIGIFQSGAYGLSASPVGFLSHSIPPEIWVEAGQDSLIRPRGAYPDFAAHGSSDAATIATPTTL